MSLIEIGSVEWKEWEHNGIVCFLCGEKFNESEVVVLWSGIVGEKVKGSPFTPNNPQDYLVLDALCRGGVQVQQNLYLHRNCVPSFCRRLLQDWER